MPLGTGIRARACPILRADSTCTARETGRRNAFQNRLMALNYIHFGEKPLVCAAHRDWGDAYQQSVEMMPPVMPDSWDTGRSRRLRVRNHVDQYHLGVWLKCHRAPCLTVDACVPRGLRP